MNALACIAKAIVSLIASLLLVIFGGTIWLLAMVIATVLEAINFLLVLFTRLVDALSPADVAKIYLKPGTIGNWTTDRALLISDGMNASWEWARAGCR